MKEEFFESFYGKIFVKFFMAKKILGFYKKTFF